MQEPQVVAKSAPLPTQHYFVSNRNQTVRSTLGHSITFAKGKATHVPRALHALVIEKGILACDASGKPLPEAGEEILEEAEQVAKPGVAPDTKEAREEAIEQVLKDIVKTNNSKEFTAGGTPSAEAVSARLGWKTDQKEVRGVWTRIRAGLLAGGGEGN